MLLLLKFLPLFFPMFKFFFIRTKCLWIEDGSIQIVKSFEENL